MQTISTVLQLASAVCEISGVILMANSLLVTTRIGIIRLLFSALYRGASARGIEFVPEQLEIRTVSVQGLAFITLGFFLQAISAILSLIWN